MASARELIGFCSDLLEAAQFHDAAVNGLQVEGRDNVTRLATAVSVNERVIRAAIEWRAHMLLVHHGLFWGEQTGVITGLLRSRLHQLLLADINLVAYHLPLDAHPVVGNNVLLAKHLGLEVERPFAEVSGRSIGVITAAPVPLELNELEQRVEALTGRSPTTLPGGPSQVRRIAILSGSGYSALDEAVSAGCDALVTGDVREPTMATARELGITVIVGGHEATERLGVQALASTVSEQFAVETQFFGDPNPI